MVLVRTNLAESYESARRERAEVVGTLPGTNVQSDLEFLAAGLVVVTGRNEAAAEFVIDGAGVAPTAGKTGTLEIPFNCTIVRWTMIADVAGSCVLDVRRCTAAVCNPPARPGAGDSIAGTDKPTLVAQSFAQDVTLAGWGSSALVKGDVLGIAVVSAATLTQVTLSIALQRT